MSSWCILPFSILAFISFNALFTLSYFFCKLSIVLLDSCFAFSLSALSLSILALRSVISFVNASCSVLIDLYSSKLIGSSITSSVCTISLYVSSNNLFLSLSTLTSSVSFSIWVFAILTASAASLYLALISSTFDRRALIPSLVLSSASLA